MLSGFSYADFSDPTDLNIVGDASVTGDDVLRLTPAVGGQEGAAWYVTSQLFVTDGFSTTLQFQMEQNADPPGGSDGFAFVIQNTNPNFVGAGGGGLGYHTLANSLAVEFDTFQNSELFDPSHSHISVHTAGTGANHASETYSLGAVNISPIMDDTAVHTAKIEYDGTTLDVYFDDLVTPVLSVAVDLGDTLDLETGSAWVGFTAATGGGWQTHDILNWDFDAPDAPATLLNIDDVTAVEGNSGTTQFALTVTRSGDVSGSATVDWTTVDGTATAASGDYDADFGQLSFAPFESTKTISITVHGDTETEINEMFSVSLSNATGATVIDGTGTGVIANDEIQITVDDVTVTEGDNSNTYLGSFGGTEHVFFGGPDGMEVGPDGLLYVGGYDTHNVVRFNPNTGEYLGEFVSVNSGGLDTPFGLTFGPDGNLYVTSALTDSILRYNGTTGEFIDAFVPFQSGGLDYPIDLAFGPDGHLYVGNNNGGDILRYDGATGAFLDVFVDGGAVGQTAPRGFLFGSDGNLYVASYQGTDIKRFEGPGGGNPGAFIDSFVAPGAGGLDGPNTLAFGPDGNLYVAPGTGSGINDILRYDGTTGAFIDTFIDGAANGVRDMIFRPDGTLLVASIYDSTIRQYDAATGQQVDVWQAEYGQEAALENPLAVTIGTDGLAYVVSAALDAVLRFDTTTGGYIDTFVASQSGGLDKPGNVLFGPDGNLYVGSRATDEVLRYDGTDGTFLGAFITAGDAGLSQPRGIEFGPDGNLYVASRLTGEILRFNGSSGAFIDVFVAAGSGGLATPRDIRFAPDGYLYVADNTLDAVLRFDATSGAFIGEFVPPGTPGAERPFGLAIDANGDVYVSSSEGVGGPTNVLKFDAGTGQLLETIATNGTGGMTSAFGMAFDDNGILYVADRDDDRILRFGAASNVVFTVSLSEASAAAVTVNFTTADGSATAGDDFAPKSGTLTFAPGQLTRTIVISTNDDSEYEGDESFTLELSGAVGAMIADGQGVATIVDDDPEPTPSTKFFVVDTSSDETFEYDAAGDAIENYNLASGNSAPRGVTTSLDGSTVWVIDADRYVYVYDADGNSLGQWYAYGTSRPDGIVVDGDDIFIVDSRRDRVYRFNGAANATSGYQFYNSYFNLNSGNKNPKGITTDGTALWVVNSASQDKVFKYSMTGSLLGSWAIGSAVGSPEGITIDPTNGDLYIVDRGDDAVYRYTGGSSRTSGSQNPDGVFNLAAGNSNPRGISDPPPPGFINLSDRLGVQQGNHAVGFEQLDELPTRIAGAFLHAVKSMNEQLAKSVTHSEEPLPIPYEVSQPTAPQPVQSADLAYSVSPDAIDRVLSGIGPFVGKLATVGLAADDAMAGWDAIFDEWSN